MDLVRSVFIVVMLGCFTIAMMPDAIGMDGVVFTIPYDKYMEWNYTFDAGEAIKYEFETGNEVHMDVYFMNDIDYELYVHYETFDSYTYGSVYNDSEGNVTFVIAEKDKYYLVFDNTDAGDADPVFGTDLVVEISITAYYLSPSHTSAENDVEVISGTNQFYYWPAFILTALIIIIIVGSVLLSRNNYDNYY